MKFRIIEKVVNGQKKYFVEEKTGYFGWWLVEDYYPIPCANIENTRFEKRPAMFSNPSDAESWIRNRHKDATGKVVKEFEI